MNAKLNEEKIVYQLDHIDQAINKLYSLKERCKVYTFSGPLGAGKTTCVKGLLHDFDIHVPVTSPTFSYVNVYENGKGQLLYHFDLYRLKDINEFMEAGFNELLFLDNSWAMIEWPELIAPLLVQSVCNVTLSYGQEPNERQMHYSLVV